MRQRHAKLPSPAMVLAGTALLIALGGTSVAAVSQIPRASVGAPQLKANAVTSPKIANNTIVSADVRNGSLLRADFRRGQIPAGPVGAQGPQGPAGLSAREQVSAETPQNSHVAEEHHRHLSDDQEGHRRRGRAQRARTREGHGYGEQADRGQRLGGRGLRGGGDERRLEGRDPRGLRELCRLRRSRLDVKPRTRQRPRFRAFALPRDQDPR